MWLKIVYMWKNLNENEILSQTICNKLVLDIVEVFATYNISNGLVVTLKQNLQYRVHVYVDHIMNYIKIILLQRVSQVRACLDFLILLKFKEKIRVLLKKWFLMVKSV